MIFVEISIGDFLKKFEAKGGDVSKLGYFIGTDVGLRRILLFRNSSMEVIMPEGGTQRVSGSFMKRVRGVSLLPLNPLSGLVTLHLLPRKSWQF